VNLVDAGRDACKNACNGPTFAVAVGVKLAPFAQAPTTQGALGLPAVPFSYLTGGRWAGHGTLSHKVA
jgi:hypothetical protein